MEGQTKGKIAEDYYNVWIQTDIYIFIYFYIIYKNIYLFESVEIMIKNMILYYIK